MSRLVAVFSRPYGEPTRKAKGPFASLVLEPQAVREVADGPLIATHVGHEWHVDGEKFWRLDVDVTVRLRFLDGATSKAYGPFSAFSAVNKVVFGEGHVFAFVDALAGHWYCHENGRYWPLMVIEPADHGEAIRPAASTAP